MKFLVPDGFDLAAIIATISVGGVNLEGSEAHPSPCGGVVQQGNTLVVTLLVPTDAKRALIFNTIVTAGGTPIE